MTVQRVSYVLVVLALVVTALALWTSVSFSAGGGVVWLLALTVWPLTPWLMMGLLWWAARSAGAARAVAWVSAVTAVLGALVTVDVTYLHADALGGLVVMVVPLVQWGVLLLLGLPLLLVLNRDQGVPTR